jgi:FKBP-type peptidyl-prolyl cis-trans isomerase
MQNFGRPETTVVAQEKRALLEKEEKVKENRPVESTQQGAQAKQKASAEAEQKVKDYRPVDTTQKRAEAKKEAAAEKEEAAKKHSAHMFEEGRVVYEKYNNNGDVILRLPPAKKPVDERV